MNDYKAAVNEAAIAARVAGRHSAVQVAPILEWPNNHGADFADGFLSEMKKLLPQRKADIVEPERLQPITRLGATVIEYGVYKGNSYDEIPIERLDWYLRMAEENAKSLRAYLKHPELEARRRGT